MNINGFVVGTVGTIAVIAATIIGIPAAEAGQCSITCRYNSCSARAGTRRVYCKCGKDGWGQCGTGSAPCARSVKDYASEEQLSSLEEHIVRAYELGLSPVGDAAAVMYEGIILGDLELYDKGFDDYISALDEISDEARILLDTGEE